MRASRSVQAVGWMLAVWCAGCAGEMTGSQTPDPTKPGSTANPSNPSDPGNPDPGNPDNPTPNNPANPNNPSNPSDPSNPSKPSNPATGTLGKRLLVGYWHNFDNGSGFIKLKDVSPKWDVINVSFAEPTGTDGTIGFTPYNYSDADFTSEVAGLRAQGKRVVISIGGANGHVQLNTTQARDNFVQSVSAIIAKYGFDGLDVDFEGQSVKLDAGDTDVKKPTTPLIVNLIAALRTIQQKVGPSFVLTMAPETFFVQVGYMSYGGKGSGDPRAGAYLPVIHALRDILTFLQVQNYNSGPIMGLDDQYHFMGGPDFHVAMVDMLLVGFPIAKDPANVFPPLHPDQVLIGLPASINAGNGFTSVSDVQKAMSYLTKGTSYGGAYTLKTAAGYPALRGLMTWSINWDAFNKFEFSTNHRAYLDAL